MSQQFKGRHDQLHGEAARWVRLLDAEDLAFLKRESGQPGDSRVPFRYRVMDGATQRVIEFRPEGRARITLKLAPALDAAGRQALAARLSEL